jgi:predicted nucleic acid-binding protein
MKYILDASVALKWVLMENDSPLAESLRDDFQRGVHDLLAPEVFAAEVAHALTRAERKGIIRPPQASVLLADILTSPPRFFGILPLLPRAVDLSSRMRFGVYDCLYVALAEREACPLVTADDRLIQAFSTLPVVALAAI